MEGRLVSVGLDAVIVAIADGSPLVLAVRSDGGGDALPSGSFAADRDRTLQLGIRRSVEERTGVRIGYLEQLYTFGDRFRNPDETAGGMRSISIGYLALVRDIAATRDDVIWESWYRYFPWEDRRLGRPNAALDPIERHLARWVGDAGEKAIRSQRHERIAVTFGLAERAWNDEAVLERYELLYESGFVEEAARDRQEPAPHIPASGKAMVFDHRRMLATGIGRLRGKIKYRPVIFELLPPRFTLWEMQQAAEAIAGTPLHKGNFRRLVVSGGLVELTGATRSATGGRPAAEFRFRHDVLREREAGVRLRAARIGER